MNNVKLFLKSFVITIIQIFYFVFGGWIYEYLSPPKPKLKKSTYYASEMYQKKLQAQLFWCQNWYPIYEKEVIGLLKREDK